LLSSGVEGLTDTAIGLKEISTGIAKSPFSFTEIMLSSGADLDKSIRAAYQPVKDSVLTLGWAFEDEGRDPLRSILRLGRTIPVVGNFVPPLYDSPEKQSSNSKTFYTRGIYGPQNEIQNKQTTKEIIDYLSRTPEKRYVDSLPYMSGTVADVAFSMLGLNKSPAYRAFDQIKKQGIRKGETVNLAGHSGGVQRILDLSGLLGIRGIGVDKIAGVAGPAMGYYPNSWKSSFAGSPSNDKVSGLQKLLDPLLFTPNKNTDFSIKLPVTHKNLDDKSREKLYFEFIKKTLR